ncbi:MAG: hypothetical protein SF053_03555 [Bacteroidia bacterium]|nr:hypothetical protein [Bacteroidia bacterium]
MQYKLTFSRSAERLIEVSLTFSAAPGQVRLRLPYWRPGRYERQYYERHITDVRATGPDQTPQPIRQTTTHTWEAEVPASGQLTVLYAYYADTPDAGGSWFDDTWIFVNPVNLLLYPEGCENTPCTLTPELPASYQLAASLPLTGGAWVADSYHTLADSPFMAARHLVHHQFQVSGLAVHIWYMGVGTLDVMRLERDITAYSEAQIQMFGGCPVEAYHYLYFLRPGSFRHGLEHARSTAIVMGPGTQLMEPHLYRLLLEISSHEFFHTWNVKALRPAEMWPYDYTQEVYSTLHYVTEGVTTYYGDLMLWKSGIWDLDQWLESVNGELEMHYRMGGRHTTSLAQSSFQSWINGYHRQGVPNRRISFYTKGYLFAMLADMLIRRATHHAASLDTVMGSMYQEIALAGRGYTEADFLGRIEAYVGADTLRPYLEAYLYGSAPMEPALEEIGQFYGLFLTFKTPASLTESCWGVTMDAGGRVIENIQPGSPVLAAGLSAGDELISLDGLKIEGHPDELLRFRREAHYHEVYYFHQRQIRVAYIPKQTHFSWKIPYYYALAGDDEAMYLANRFQWQRIGEPG